MSKEKRTIVFHDEFAGMPQIQFLNSGARPSWRNFSRDDDWNQISIYGHTVTGSVNITTRENAGMGGTNRAVQRVTMVSIDAAAGRELLAYLKKLYGEA